jgi:hypothetical protein
MFCIEMILFLKLDSRDANAQDVAPLECVPIGLRDEAGILAGRML